VTSKSPTGGSGTPTPRDPPHADDARPDQTRAEAGRARDAQEKTEEQREDAPRPAGTAGVVAGTEGLPGRPPGDEPHVVPGAKSPGPEVVPPAQTNAAEAELSRAETRPAGRAAPEPDAKDEPGGGGMPGDVHPAVAEYEAKQAEQAERAAKDAKDEERKK
jgi:hypothetical protein